MNVGNSKNEWSLEMECLVQGIVKRPALLGGEVTFTWISRPMRNLNSLIYTIKGLGEVLSMLHSVSILWHSRRHQFLSGNGLDFFGLEVSCYCLGLYASNISNTIQSLNIYAVISSQH